MLASIFASSSKNPENARRYQPIGSRHPGPGIFPRHLSSLVLLRIEVKQINSNFVTISCNLIPRPLMGLLYVHIITAWGLRHSGLRLERSCWALTQISFELSHLLVHQLLFPFQLQIFLLIIMIILAFTNVTSLAGHKRPIRGQVT